MPLIETKGAASAQGFGGAGAGASGPVTYIEDVFSTYLYTGNGSTQTITNGIDLSTKGGLVWIKGRSGATDHALYDTTRGATKDLVSNSTAAETTQSTGLTAFNGTGFSIGALAKLNTNAATYVSWTFREQPKFFDVVTYTGNGSARTIAHNLGSVPGCIIIKRTDSTSPWPIYHRSRGTSVTGNLRDSAQGFTPPGVWNSTTPTSTVFSIGTSSDVNANGGTYVAYLFAHDAGGFGLTGTDNVITCSQFTLSSSTGTQDISLGYEPQWIMFGPAAFNGEQMGIYDSMRGMSLASATKVLRPSASTAEDSFGPAVWPNATGFTVYRSYFLTGTYVFIAIRRGPMKTPTSGTSVFNPVVYTGTNVDNRLVDMSLLTDMTFARQRDSTTVNGMVVGDRLRGDPYLLTASTNAENAGVDSFMTPTVGYGNAFSSMVGFGVGNDATSRLNISTTTDNQIAEGFRRAPGFFDVVCYTGTGSATTQAHNLGVVPEMIIVKKRAGGTAASWSVYASAVGNTKWLVLNGDLAPITDTGAWNNTSPTSSVFTVGVNGEVNTLSSTYVAYLFATCPGVSKVGSYTGTGTTKQIDCGFTGGARFVLIKRTDSTGDWYVWDSARGIVAGNDPYLLLNSTAAEVTNTDYVDTYSAGFEISSTAPAAINANGGTYIFLAIA